MTGDVGYAPPIVFLRKTVYTSDQLADMGYTFFAHDGRLNISFIDGHAGNMKWADAGNHNDTANSSTQYYLWPESRDLVN